MLDSLQRASLYVLGLTLLLVTMLTLGSNSDPYSMASRSTHMAVLPLILALNVVLMGLFVVCGCLEARRLALYVLDRDNKGKVTCGDVWWFVNARLLNCLPCSKSQRQASSAPTAHGQVDQGPQLQPRQ
jgi:cytochrome c oxidase assembly factor CtaG